MIRYLVTIFLTVCLVLGIIYQSMLPHLTTWIVSDYSVLPQDFQLASKGNPEALTKIGDMYYASEQYKKSVPFYQQSTEKNYVPAIVKLASMYKNGVGVEQDNVKANALLFKASLNGDVDAIKSLSDKVKDAFGIK